MRAEAILETVMYANDPQACGAFYAEVFGLAIVRSVADRFCFLRCGMQMLLIFEPNSASGNHLHSGIPTHGAHGPGHVCFRATNSRNLDDWREWLIKSGVPIEHEHIWGTGGRSIYMRDPAGNSVEIAEAGIWQA